jgi:hypothetical protein
VAGGNVTSSSCNTLHTASDLLQVETIGDAYMVAAGLLDTPADHAAAVTNMAFGMMREARKVMEPGTNSPLQVRTSERASECVCVCDIHKSLKPPPCSLLGSYWDTHWPSRGRCGGEEDASLLFVWRHSEHRQ